MTIAIEVIVTTLTDHCDTGKTVQQPIETAFAARSATPIPLPIDPEQPALHAAACAALSQLYVAWTQVAEARLTVDAAQRALALGQARGIGEHRRAAARAAVTEAIEQHEAAQRRAAHAYRAVQLAAGAA